MEGVLSPDVPAWVCYLVVLVVGVLVAVGTVRRELGGLPQYWGYPTTWSVFVVLVIVPPALYWLLDFSGAVYDTSLIGALLVAFGYRGILGGKEKRITASGEALGLWTLFIAWLEFTWKRIHERDQRAQEHLRECITPIAAEERRLPQLRAVTYQHTRDAALLTNAIAAARATVPDGLPEPVHAQYLRQVEARSLIRDLQTSRHGDYPEVLGRAGVLKGREVVLAWFLRRRGHVFAAIALLASIALGVGVWRVTPVERVVPRYYLWRLEKANASQRDRFRTRQFYMAEADRSKRLGDGGAGLQRLLAPVIVGLGYEDLPLREAEERLELVTYARDRGSDSLVLRDLIGSLRNGNSAIRLLVHTTLLQIHDLDYARTLEKAEATRGLRDWKPDPKESAADIEGRVRAWTHWLDKLRS